MLKTVPEKLIVGAWVHMDENQPHMHFCFCPVVHTAVMTNDLAHGNPISDTDTDSDSWGGLEGRSPSISAQPSGQGRGAATDDAQQSRPLGGLRRSPAGHVLSVAKV